ncbi:hypothetical protein HIM_09218 [Hirsutella minnesotensis 3608]|uniref:Uncharacterized protein n=1 Tax=Hirsutella minnesotensis 3608 TaxID=1043627 RepID=A0A0F7ZXV4_9HYPO|nr:hypothetical protein HIM_09218 [Hirsutella minnesotensis 3608]
MSGESSKPTRREDESEALENYKRFSIARNEQIDQEAQTGDKHTLDVTVQSHVPVLTHRFTSTSIPLVLIEAELHNFWYTVTQAAKHWTAANPKHDTLVRLILSARARGSLGRTLESAESISFSDGGKLWSDLPLLGNNLADEWTNRYYRLDYDADGHDRRVNLASFVGRLVSVGLYSVTCVPVLSLFRETLEISRCLVSTSAAAADLPVVSLVQALGQLLCYSEGAAVVLCAGAGNGSMYILPSDVSALGELALQSGLVASPGFSTERWQFWVQRLEELSRCEVQVVAQSASQCLRYMSDK